jgi:hypothetical protein
MRNAAPGGTAIVPIFSARGEAGGMGTHYTSNPRSGRKSGGRSSNAARNGKAAANFKIKGEDLRGGEKWIFISVLKAEEVFDPLFRRQWTNEP